MLLLLIEKTDIFISKIIFFFCLFFLIFRFDIEIIIYTNVYDSKPR